MRRLRLSISCGLAVIGALALMRELVAKYSSLDYLTSGLTYIIIWPFLLWRAAFGSESDYWPSDTAIIFTIACHVLIFSLLSYAFLSWRNIPKRLP